MTDPSFPTAAEASETTARPVLEIGRAWMMDRGSAAAGQALGLEGPFGLWVVGRVGAMGSVSAEVAAAALGFMSPAMVASIWDARPADLDPRDAAQAYADHAATWARNALADVQPAVLDECAELVHRVNAAALPSTGALFAGWRTMPVPDDSAGRAIMELQVLRELRGGAHLAAVHAVGLGPHGAIMSFGDEVRGGVPGSERFGWSEPHPVPDAQRRATAEELTTAACVSAFEALDGPERARLVSLVLEVRSHIDI